MAKGLPSFHVAFGAPASPEAEIRPEDWLNVRRSTGAEQRLAGLKSWHYATTYHFRACDIALPLVIGQRIRQPAGSVTWRTTAIGNSANGHRPARADRAQGK